MIWAGDLDGDGKLDLIMGITPFHDMDEVADLYLSSQAKGAELVGHVASFASWQDCG